MVVVADSHLSSHAPEALANWDAVVGYVDDVEPDLVVHLGDLTLDGCNDSADLVTARDRLDRLAAPWRVIPGNHDIGDNPNRGIGHEPTIDVDRLARWRQTIGHDWWTLDVGGWTLVAANAQLFGSGLDAEHDQWAWLAQELAGRGPQRPIGLLTHKPLSAPDEELAAAPSHRFVPPAARARIEALSPDSTVPLVMSGHVHQFRILDVGERRHVWAPTTWAVLPEEIQPTFGVKRCGVVSLTLSSGRRVGVALVEPRGMTQLTVTRDVPNPYHH